MNVNFGRPLPSRREFMTSAAHGSSALGLLLANGCARRNGSAVSHLSMQTPWINDSEFIGYFVGLEEGFFTKAGLTLDYKSGGPEIIAEGTVMSRQADVALAPIETTASLILKENASLRIIGAQYQKNPLGVVSLTSSNIREPHDLIGRTLAVPQANVLTIESLLKINKVPLDRVRIVPYAYDPRPLLNGQVDATVDFVTNVPYSIRQAGGDPAHFLLWDWGFKVYQDIVVVLEETLRTRRASLLAWLTGSRQGWTENFKDPSLYPRRFMNSYFRQTGRTVANEIAFNDAQKSLIQTEHGIFSMTDEDIENNLATLSNIGLRLNKDVFDTGLLRELRST